MTTGCLDAHPGLERVLSLLRRVVPERDPVRTAAVLDVLRARLLAHMQLEEDELLPIYAERLHPPPNGAADMFRADHERLVRLVESISPEATTAEEVLTQAEVLTRFAGTLEHHDARERRWLDPGLSAHVEPAVLAEWQHRFAAADAAQPTLPEEDLRPAPQPPPPPTDPVEACRLAVACDRDPNPADLDACAALQEPFAEKARALVTRVRSLGGDQTDLAHQRDRRAAAHDVLWRLRGLVHAARLAAGM